MFADPTVQLRLEWSRGSDHPRQWQGTVTVDHGTVSVGRILGNEADEPGSIWADGNRIEIRQRSKHGFDGCDFSVTAPPSATITIEFRDLQDPATSATSQTTIADLIAKPSIVTELDKVGNRLVIRRTPGDMLHVKLSQDRLVFSPGEALRIDIEPRSLPVAAGTALQLRARMTTANGAAEAAVQEQSFKTGGEESVPASLTFDFKAPPNEGVYDVAIEAYESPALRWAKPKLVADRHVQLVVIKDRPVQSTTEANTPWSTVMEIDPANPRWYERFGASSLLPSLGQGNFGNVTLQPWQHAGGSAMQIAANISSEMHWQAYPLSITRFGMPHILEVEVPSDVPQTLGISVVEPNAVGSVVSIGLDSGVNVFEESIPGQPHWARHRILFWPRTKNPIVLLTNRRDDLPAVFGKIRVLTGPNHLPHAPLVVSAAQERLMGGYQSRPLIPENFGAMQALDMIGGRSLDDWQSFYDGGQRLVEYLNYIGYGAEMVTVAADGAAIYPSAVLEATSRYDNGVLFENGQDPVRKDVLELMLRLFDREGLKLVPTLQFASPLPELEQRLRNGGNDAAGIMLVGATGEKYLDRYPARRGIGPYYNPLNKNVQQAMLAAVHELVQRYNQHSSFAGLGIELSADSYAILPGELWGLDDETIAQFQHDTGIQVPGTGVTRYEERAQFLAETDGASVVKPQRKAWLKWRAGVIADFYKKLQNELTSVRPDAEFFLAATNLFDGMESQRMIRPALPSKAHIDQALMALGIDAETLRDQPGLVLLRPVRSLPTGPIAAQGLDLELNRAADLDEQFHGSETAGAVFINNPQGVRLPSFDARSPFGKDKVCNLEVNAEVVPLERRNRQRFVHTLATTDADFLFDGGWLLPMGQEDSLFDLIGAYRRLPVGKFKLHGESTPPVTIRSLSRDNSTYVYLVNDSEWPVNAQLVLDIPLGCRIEELSGGRRLPTVAGNNWSLPMEPFDFVAVRFLASEVKIKQASVGLDNSKIRPWLDNRVRDLLQRKAMLANQTPLPGVVNPSFEAPAAKGGQIPGWSLLKGVGGSVTLDSEGTAVPQKPIGKQAVKLESKEPPVSLRSDPIPAPTAGRLGVSVWLRIEDPQQQPIVRLAVEYVYQGRSCYRPAQVGQGGNQIHIGDQWTHFQLQLDDLPPTNVEKLQVRFDLMTPGCVWIDDVQVFDKAFSPSELDHLGKILALADFQLHNDQLVDCMHELEGYWPKFLFQNVLLQAAPAGQTPLQQADRSSAPKADEKSGKSWLSLPLRKN